MRVRNDPVIKDNYMRLKINPKTSCGRISLNIFIPLALIAVISLSLESLPKDNKDAVKAEIGRVYVSRKGIIRIKSFDTLKIFTPLLITKSAILTRLPINITKVNTPKDKNRGPMNSFKK